MHDQNSFITLTYSDENLKSTKLIYEDFQLFMKRLRSTYPNQEIGMFVTGEYGDQFKRPHWHALLFNWEPKDKEYKYTNDNGDSVYSSNTLDKLWGNGITELGTVTFKSAGYVARYAAKKLVHGNDEDHSFHPISKKSSKNAIGKKWLEKYWTDVFNHGQCILEVDNEIIKCSIPRYYEKWLQKNHLSAWENYVTNTKQKKIAFAQERAQHQSNEYGRTIEARARAGKIIAPVSPKEVKTQIINERFKRLQKGTKGDI